VGSPNRVPGGEATFSIEKNETGVKGFMGGWPFGGGGQRGEILAPQGMG